MTHFLQRLLLFSVPFWLYGLFIYLTDPYNFLGGPPVISNQVKMRTAFPLNYCLWKYPDFQRHPSSNLLLGDSRMDGVKPERVKAITGQDYYNLAFGGATIREIVESFWFASRHARLHNVRIGLNFNLYTDYEQMDRSAEVVTIERDPLFYFLNRTVAKAAVLGVVAQSLKYDPRYGAVDSDRETFWRHQIGPQTAAFFARYVYPRKYHGDLEKIAKYAKENGIDLSFVIFPTHVELQNRVGDFGLEGEYARFKQDLGALAPTYDFDIPSEVTLNKDNFSDPYHSRKPVIDEVIREIWSGTLKYGRLLQPDR